MEWCKLYARLPGDKAILAVGEKAAWLFVVGLCYCAQEESDGFIPVAQLPRFGLAGAPARARQLVDHGLWSTVPGGWQVTRWLDRQESSENLRQSRAGDAERQRRRRARQRAGVSPGVSHAVTPPVKPAVSHGTKSKSKNKTEDPPGGASAPPDTTNAIIGEYVQRCRQRPPSSVLAQLGKHVKALLAEGIDPDDIRRGLAIFMTKDVAPSVLPSLVNGVMNRQAPSAAPNGYHSPTDANIAAFLGLDQPMLRALPGGGT